MVECQTTLEQLRESNPAHTIAKWTPLLDNIAGRVQMLEHQLGDGEAEKNVAMRGQVEHLQCMLSGVLQRVATLESVCDSKGKMERVSPDATPIPCSVPCLTGTERHQTTPLPLSRMPQPTSNACGMPRLLTDPPLPHIDVFPMGPILGPKSDLDALFEQARRFGFSLVRTGGGVPFSQGKDTPLPIGEDHM